MERNYIQLVFFILFLAYTGSKPKAIVESETKNIRNTNEALKYKDIKFTLVRPDNETVFLLVIKVQIVFDKRRKYRKK